jgi:N-acetylneuraminic acid mutarotase
MAFSSLLFSLRLSKICTSVILSLVLLICLSFGAQTVSADSIHWVAKTSMNEPRTVAGVAVSNGKIYVAGGVKPPNFLPVNTVEEFNPGTDQWITRDSLQTPRSNLGLTAANGKLYAIGGQVWTGSSYQVVGTVEEYDPVNGGSWVTKSPMPTARTSLAVVTVRIDDEDKIYAIGGSDADGQRVSTVQEYNPITDQWVTKANLLNPVVSLAAAAADNGSGMKIYAIGGNGNCGCPLQQVEEYNPSLNNWVFKTDMPTGRSNLGATKASNGKIYAVGGDSLANHRSDKVEEFNPNTNTWITTNSLLTGRDNVAVVATENGKLYAVGGTSAGSPSIRGLLEEGTIVTQLTVTTGGPYQVDEGGSVEVTATATDPENGPLTYAWDLDNNGSFETPGQEVTFSAAGLDGPSTKTIAVQVTDDQNLTATSQATVDVQNVAPTVGAITAPPDPTTLNTQITASALFTDPGTQDTHTAFWNWGDGNTTAAGTVTETNGSGSVSDTHTYTTPGVYTIILIVTDKDNAPTLQTYQYVTIYDPTPQGLFTGARLFSSPAGAYSQDPNVTGIVQFGVVAKYSAAAPTANVSMNFKDANLKFESTSTTSLVINNGLAILRGTGTINGSGSYEYLVTGFDSSPDTIRFQIKDSPTNVIYDTQPGDPLTASPTTTITGQVIIH